MSKNIEVVLDTERLEESQRRTIAAALQAKHGGQAGQKVPDETKKWLLSELKQRGLEDSEVVYNGCVTTVDKNRVSVKLSYKVVTPPEYVELVPIIIDGHSLKKDASECR